MMGAERQGQEQMIRKMKQFENVIYDMGAECYWQNVTPTDVLTGTTAAGN